MPNIDKEAALDEVLSHVSVTDLWSQIKTVIAGLGCWTIFSLIGAGIDVGAKGVGLNIDIPNWVFWSLVILFFIYNFTATKSYHEFRFEIYFPKMNFIGSVILTSYLVGTFQIYQIAISFADTVLRWGAMGAIYIVLIAPMIVLLGAMELGHKRLMEKRCDELGG